MRVLATILLLSPPAFAATPVERAVDYLAREVPRWSRENHCFSCHNNGDGARALYTARRLHFAVPDAALADTTAWLLRPLDWDRNGGSPAASDKKLARIQFAAALAESGADRSALVAAAASLVPYQESDGSWQADSGSETGSPATWGSALATWMTRRVLEAAGAVRFREPIRKADSWLRAAKPQTVADAAVLLMAGRRESLDYLRTAQTRDGGWGPRPHAPTEVFDTALVLLALPPGNEMIEPGRRFLIRMQSPDGGWPETTRPPGGQSYAQQISTSAWATLALLATDAER
jgi:hypothetical protein